MNDIEKLEQVTTVRDALSIMGSLGVNIDLHCRNGEWTATGVLDGSLLRATGSSLIEITVNTIRNQAIAHMKNAESRKLDDPKDSNGGEFGDMSRIIQCPLCGQPCHETGGVIQRHQTQHRDAPNEYVCPRSNTAVRGAI